MSSTGSNPKLSFQDKQLLQPKSFGYAQQALYALAYFFALYFCCLMLFLFVCFDVLRQRT